MNDKQIEADITRLLPVQKGHFLLESGHHGDLWLDLELLCLRPEPVQRWAAELAARLAGHEIDAVCGPLVEGAFVALMVAASLHVPFTYAERCAAPKTETLYSVQYRLPRRLRAAVRGKRVAIVDDIINAGSAIRGTFADLETCGATPVAIAALAVLGESASTLAAEKRIILETLASLPNEVWTPSECPLCRRGLPLTDSLGE